MAAGLIVIDMLNPYEHEGAEPLKASVRRMLGDLCALIAGAREEGLRIVYVNDNNGDWTAGPKEIAQHALAGASPDLVEPVLPPEEAPFIVKARHSIFYETLLEYLLRREEINRLVLAGQVTEQCILYSALDGYVRHYSIVIPRDAVAHIHADLAEAALRMMRTNMRAHVTSAANALAAPIRAP